MKIVKIDWTDSNISHGQYGQDEIFPTACMETVGFLVSEGKTGMVVARDLVDDDDVRDIISIPKENIKSVNYL